MNRLRHVLAWAARATAGLVGTAALLAGLPWLLWTQIGDPRHNLPRLTQDWWTGPTLQHGVALAVWALWAAFTVVFALEAVAVVRGVRAPRTMLLSPLHALASLLVATMLTAPVAAAAVPSIPRPATAAAGVAVTAAQTHTIPAADTDAADVTVRVGDQHYTYTVHHGDTLWHIADVWLHNPLRWHDIYQLNQATYDQHGRMHHGNLILPGWVLVLPPDATPPPDAAPTGPPAGASHSPAPAPSATSRPSPPATPAASQTPTPSAVATPDPAPTTPVGATADSHTSTPTAAPRRDHSIAPRPGIVLSGTDWLDLGLAGVLLAAGGLIWAHRRRRYTPQPPTPRLRLDDPDLAPLPDGIRHTRRILRPQPTDPPPTGATTDNGDWFRDIATEIDTENHDPGRGITNGTDADADTEQLAPVSVPDASAAPLMLPTLTGPICGLWPPAGLGLTGPAADDAARGFLVTALADITGVDPDARTQVVIPSGTLATLLGADAVLLGDSPRLHVTAGLAEALTLLEQATLARTRAVYDSEAEDITGLRDHDGSADPVPPLLLIADAAARHERTRVASLLTQGQRLDIHGVLLGEWPDGDTVAVAPGGATAPTDRSSRHGQHPADIGRLTVLDAGNAADLLRAAIEADTGTAQPTGWTTTPPVAAADLTAQPLPEQGTPAVSDPAGSDPPAAAHDTAVPGSGDAEPVALAQSPAAAPEDAASAPPTTSLPGPAGTVDVRVLGGTVAIVGAPPDSKAKPPLRVKSRELLAYLMAHPRGATEEILYQEVFTELHTGNGASMLNTYVSNLRRNLRAVGGPGTYVVRPKGSERCDLEPHRLDCDLWRMQRHIRLAQTAANPADRIAEYRAAIAEYTGPFAEPHGYEWAEPVREAIRQQALDAHVALADLLARTDRPAALQILTRAIGHDPYNEAIYRKAMRLHAADGDADAIRQLTRDLTTALAEIPAEPSDATIELADQISRGHRGGHR